MRGGDRFIQEIKTTAALQHPHILPLFDSGVADGSLFYVMPFIDGETLRDKLSRETQPLATSVPRHHRGGFAEIFPALSPDGRWLAYASNESGSFEVYVRPFPDVNARRVQVSQAGGTEPRWSHSGRELFYRNGAGELVSAAVVPAAGFTLGSQAVLFDASRFYHGDAGRSYDVALGDQRFVFLERAPVANENVPEPDKLIEVVNWATEVRARIERKTPQ